MYNQAFLLKKDCAHHWPALSWLQALLHTCLVSCQNCVKSLSGDLSSWGWHWATAFSFAGKFQFLGTYCLSCQTAKCLFRTSSLPSSWAKCFLWRNLPRSGSKVLLLLSGLTAILSKPMASDGCIPTSCREDHSDPACETLARQPHSHASFCCVGGQAWWPS